MSAAPVRDDYIRPSALSAIAICPGRPTMEAAVERVFGQAEEEAEDDEEGEEEAPERGNVAQLGTEAHAWGETGIRLLAMDRDGKPNEILPHIDTIIAKLNELHAEPEVTKMDKWTWWCIEFYVRKVHELCVMHDIQPLNILVEHHLTMDGLGFRQGGTSDCILVVPFVKVIVIDFKAGFLDQDDASEHDQLAAYAYGAAKEFSVDQVQVWIVAPRCDKDRRVSGGAFDAEALRTAGIWIEAITRRARIADPEIVPSYTSCLYCKALTRCNPARSWLMNTQEALTLIGDPTDADEWGRLADAQAIAGRFNKEGKAKVKKHLIGGGQATGWKLGAGRAIWSLLEVAKAIDFLDEKGFTEMCSNALTIKIGKLSQEARDLLEGEKLIEERPSSPSLKPVKGAKAAL